MNNSLVHRGYDARNKNSLDPKYICFVCHLIFKNPIQLNCGHRICKLHLPDQTSAIQCPQCSQTTMPSEIVLDKGFINDMKTLQIECNFCEWSGLYKAYQLHLDEKHGRCECSYCQEIFDSVTARDHHVNTTCPEAQVNCYLKPNGCTEPVLRRDLPEHYLSEGHQRIVLVVVLQVIATMTKDTSQFSQRTTDIDQPIQAATTTSTSLVSDKYNEQMNNIKQTLDILHAGVGALQEEQQHTTDKSLQLSQSVKTTDQDLVSLKLSIEESNVDLEGQKTVFDIFHQTVLCMKQELEDKQYTSYDGTLVWKITNVAEKMADPMYNTTTDPTAPERPPSIYSPPFYSSSSGYKMCARLYLLGDGNARGNHMSLFFVLMRSDNDGILRFPFNYKVSFSLLDQSGRGEHKIDSFRPDIRSTSFQRPRSRMNIASGIPKFVSLETLQQSRDRYIKDDTMFIRIMVDFANLSKEVMEYAMGLNPGMPMAFQQKMIQEEIQKQPPTAESKTESEPSTPTRQSTSQSNLRRFFGGKSKKK